MDNIEVRDIMNYRDILVTVILLVYNHAPYIEKTLKSILNQKINFKMQLLIHDDASTDGTSDIIRRYADEYPDIITLIIQNENKFQKDIAVDLYAIPFVYGKYVALCEGDDCWSVLDKLQKQVNYMEQHPDIVGTGGMTRYYNDEGVECKEPMPTHQFLNRVINKKEFANCRGFEIASSTLMIKTGVIKNEYFANAKKCSPRVGDSLVLVSMFEKGDLYMFSDCFQNHRVQTRAKASNYNSLYGATERYRDVVRVLNASVLYLKSDLLKKRFIRNTSIFFWIHIRQHNLKKFFETIKEVVPSHKKYVIVAMARTFLVVIPSSVIRHLKTFSEGK